METEELAGSLLEAGVEAGWGQVHAVRQAFDDGDARGEPGVMLVVGGNYDPRLPDGIVLYVDSPQSEQAAWEFPLDKLSSKVENLNLHFKYSGFIG